eukprot:5058105-Prymnesium_polylepis.2
MYQDMGRWCRRWQGWQHGRYWWGPRRHGGRRHSRGCQWGVGRWRVRRHWWHGRHRRRWRQEELGVVGGIALLTGRGGRT